MTFPLLRLYFRGTNFFIVALDEIKFIFADAGYPGQKAAGLLGGDVFGRVSDKGRSEDWEQPVGFQTAKAVNGRIAAEQHRPAVNCQRDELYIRDPYYIAPRSSPGTIAIDRSLCAA
jgi:hypothetical protein